MDFLKNSHYYKIQICDRDQWEFTGSSMTLHEATVWWDSIRAYTHLTSMFRIVEVDVIEICTTVSV